MAAFDTLCPHCKSRLKIDTEVNAVIDWAAPEDPKTFENLDTAVQALKVHDQERESKFQASVEAEKSKKAVLEKKFEELFKKAHDDTTRPIRDIDLD